MEKLNNIQIHHDHVIWNSDMKMWKHDVEMWEDEILALHHAIGFIKQAVDNHEAAVEEHGKSLNDHQSMIKNAEFEMSVSDDLNTIEPEELEKHEREGDRHVLQQKAHERLKKYHHTIMALTKGLKKALGSLDIES